MPGGGWEGVPKNRAGSFCDYPADTGARRKTAAGEERGASTKDRREDQHAGGDGVDVETGGNGVPGDSNGK